MKTSTIVVEKKAEYVLLTLNRPDKRNALNDAMISELTTFFSTDHQLPVIITGAGTAFCAGADLEYLKGLRQKGDDENNADSIALKNLYWSIYSYPQQTIAMVNGAAIAGGCGLVTVCDYVIADEASKFGYPEVKIGFVAALVSVFLLKQLGAKRSARLLYSGKLITAKEAGEIGLVDEVFSSNLIAAAEQRVFELNKVAPEALRITKKLLNIDLQPELPELLNIASQVNVKTRKTSDFVEGISAFLDKRKPSWGL